MRRLRDDNYERSNAVTTVEVAITAAARDLTDRLLRSSGTAERQGLGEALLDELADGARVDICTLKVSETQQYHRRGAGRHGIKQ